MLTFYVHFILRDSVDILVFLMLYTLLFSPSVTRSHSDTHTWRNSTKNPGFFYVFRGHYVWCVICHLTSWSLNILRHTIWVDDIDGF